MVDEVERKVCVDARFVDVEARFVIDNFLEVDEEEEREELEEVKEDEEVVDKKEEIIIQPPILQPRHLPSGRNTENAANYINTPIFSKYYHLCTSRFKHK